MTDVQIEAVKSLANNRLVIIKELVSLKPSTWRYRETTTLLQGELARIDTLTTEILYPKLIALPQEERPARYCFPP